MRRSGVVKWSDSPLIIHVEEKRFTFFFFSCYLLADSVGKPIELNLYQYARNNPVNFVDPLGLFSVGDVDWVKVGFGAMGAAEGIQTLALGGTAIVGTAMLTRSPTLTTIVGAEMIPVFWVGIEKTKHGYEMIHEGIIGHGRQSLQPTICHKQTKKY